MTAIHTSFLTRTVWLSFVLAVAGCSASPNPRYYILEPVSLSSASSNVADAGLTVLVGPVTLPEYLNRDGLVAKSAPYEITVAEFDRWAEPLEKGTSVALARILAAELGSERVVDYYSNIAVVPDYSVRVRILDFGLGPDRAALLTALWSVENRGGEQVQLRTTEYSAIVRNDGTTAVVAVMSEVLGELGRDIADAIKEARFNVAEK